MVLHSYICMLVLVHTISVHHSFTTELVIKRSNNKKSCSKSLLVIQASVYNYHCSEAASCKHITAQLYKHYHNAWIVQVFTLILFILNIPLCYPYSQMISLAKSRQIQDMHNMHATIPIRVWKFYIFLKEYKEY